MAQPGTPMLVNAFGVSNTRRTRRPSKALTELRKVLKGLFDPYRPELHYMRGPGPKWRAKHSSTGPSGS
jgi:hypothetical protein